MFALKLLDANYLELVKKDQWDKKKQIADSSRKSEVMLISINTLKQKVKQKKPKQSLKITLFLLD